MNYFNFDPTKHKFQFEHDEADIIEDTEWFDGNEDFDCED